MLEGAESCYIWRLRIPFNEASHPRNYLQKLLNYEWLLNAENSVSHLDEFVEKSIESLKNNISPGIYNMTNSGSINVREVTDWIREDGVSEKEFNFLITKISL